MRTWHAAIASFGTAAFLVGAYIAILSVSGALFAFTDLATPAPVAPLRPVVAEVGRDRPEPVVAREPRPRREPAEAPDTEPEPSPAGPAAPAFESQPASSPSSGRGRGDSPSGENASGGNGRAREAEPFEPPPETEEERESKRDGAPLLSSEGVNLSGPVRNAAEPVNRALDDAAKLDLRGVTDPVNRAVDSLERGLGLDRQGR